LPKKKKSLEENLIRLEEIAEQMENSDTDLSAAMKLYKEGIIICAECAEALDAAKQEVEEISVCTSKN